MHRTEEQKTFEKALAIVIRRTRLALGLSQEELAHQVGLHRTYMSDIEKGRRNLTLHTLVMLADGLQVSCRYLIRQAETAPSEDPELPTSKLGLKPKAIRQRVQKTKPKEAQVNHSSTSMNRTEEQEAFEMALAFVIKRDRRILGLSQEELAHRAGIHRTYMSDIEKGKRNMSLQTLLLLAEGLQVSCCYLIRTAEANAGKLKSR